MGRRTTAVKAQTTNSEKGDHMADEQKPEVPVEKYLDDFKGSPAEQRKQKSELISKFGFEAYEKIVLNSRGNVKR
jgi:hypothetical protein